MQYSILATDYDGTLARHGLVDDATIAALGRLRESGRRALMVTGREMVDLEVIFHRLDLFDLIVAENGAVLYWPHTNRSELLHDAPSQEFVEALRQRGVEPLSVGQVIVATVTPHDAAVLDLIKAFRLDLQIIFNKGAVMVLPSGVNKATGLAAALQQMNTLPEKVVGVGDAENDHALLNFCGRGVAVANAVSALKEHADIVTKASHGAGVAELIDRMIATDLQELPARPSKPRSGAPAPQVAAQVAAASSAPA